MERDALTNCKRCGTLFIKNTRDVCDTCYKLEVSLAEKIKAYIATSEKHDKPKVTVDEILKATKIPKKEFENLFEKGRLFSVVSNIIIKCRFCGLEFKCEKQKASFVCPKCIIKFGKQNKSKVNAKSEEAKKREKAVKQSVAKGKMSRYGFIQNLDF